MNYNSKNPDSAAESIKRVCRLFRIESEISEIKLLTGGNINTTYYVRTSDGKEYLVQRVNCYVFRDPISVMHNIDLVTTHMIQSNKQQGVCDRRARLHFHHAENGRNYVFLSGDENHITGDSEFWRVSNYIGDTVTFETGTEESILRRTGRAFGHFQRQLCDFDASLLTETIPDFHNTPKRLDKLFSDESTDECGRCCDVADELKYIRENSAFVCSLRRGFDAGDIPARVTHNDTKINNVLFDKDTLEPVTVIDLDTVMPGLAAYDFGDAVRSAACSTSEDEKDLSKVYFDLDRFAAFTEGFISETRGILSEREISSLPLGAAVITLELASRFLDDYITGDRYFTIRYDCHNLDRARCQLALFRDIMAKYDRMNEIVAEIAK